MVLYLLYLTWIMFFTYALIVPHQDESRKTGGLYYLEEGTWYLALVNDQRRKERITFSMGDASKHSVSHRYRSDLPIGGILGLWPLWIWLTCPLSWWSAIFVFRSIYTCTDHIVSIGNKTITLKNNNPAFKCGAYIGNRISSLGSWWFLKNPIIWSISSFGEKGGTRAYTCPIWCT